jgi:hypothetical protein
LGNGILKEYNIAIVEINTLIELTAMNNTAYRKPLPGTQLDYFDTRAAVDDIQSGAYDTLPYTSRVLAEQLVRRCDVD